jgi:long-chain-fatty-acid--CoA ligase ACSBG
MGGIKPGNCMTLIYTSGTTGMPKGVMISHDNLVWTSKSSISKFPKEVQKPCRMVCYLPLSHAAGQFIDMARSLITGNHMFFADSSALQGNLIPTVI